MLFSQLDKQLQQFLLRGTMASSKSLLLLLCALFAIVLIVSSQVAASADHTKHSKETTGLEEGKYGGPGNGYPGGGYEGRGGYSGRGGYPGRECRYRCDCRGYHYAQGCQRCCANANETPDAQFEHDHPN